MTGSQIKNIFPMAAETDIKKYLPYINMYAGQYGVDTPLRMAAFLGQVGHESGQLRYVEELADGAAYEGRADLGNNLPGDGMRFKGRGLIQITGRSNYGALSRDLGVDFLASPRMLAQPEWAVRSAYWYWNSRRLNALADKGDYRSITKRVNGGMNGWADRLRLYEYAKRELGA